MSELAVICIGNRLAAADALGCRVYDRLTAGGLAATAAQEGVDIIDGGLGGLDLIRVVEGRRRVVFVDALAGIGAEGDILVLDRDEVAVFAGGYGHGAGLPYLLHMLPQVCDAPLPEIALVGAEGQIDEPGLTALAQRSLEIVLHGTH